jgi:hypothetical protein
MASIVAINGIRLDQVRMPLEPHDSRTVSFLSYPANQIHISQTGKTLSLVLPAYLALELYRTGLLPQDPDTAVSVQIDENEKRNSWLQMCAIPIRTMVLLEASNSRSPAFRKSPRDHDPNLRWHWLRVRHNRVQL